MFFAFYSLPSRQETAGGQTRRPRSPLRFDTGALPASAINKITIRGHDPAFNQHCTAKHIKLKINCTWTAKNLPYRLTPVTLSHFIAGPLGVIAQRKRDFFPVTIY